jgi:hypothetical protein
VHTARFAPGVIGQIMDGEGPARVPDNVIDELRSREHNGLIVLPKKPQLAPGADFRSTIA